MINMACDDLRWRGVCCEPVSLTAIGTALAGVGGAAAAGTSIYQASKGGSSSPARASTPAPEVRETPRMPDIDDPRVREERRRRMAARRGAGGRDSTDMVDSGGTDYSGSVLGE